MAFTVPRGTSIEFRSKLANVAIHVYLGSFGLLLVFGAIIWFRDGGSPDFAHLYAEAILVQKNPPSEIYNLEKQAAIQRELFGNQFYGGKVMPFVQPPFTLLFISPLGYLSYRQARLVWLTINLLLILLLPWAFGRWNMGVLSDQRILVLLGALSFYPFLACLWQGQISLLFLWIVIGSYFLLRTQKDFWAGVLLGLAFIRFHLAYLLVLPLILKRRRHAFLGFAVSVGSLLTVSVSWIGVQGFDSYVFLLQRMSKDKGTLLVAPDKFQNWIGQLQLWGLNDGRRTTGSIILGLLGAVLVATIWRGSWTPQSITFGLRFGATVMVALLMSPYVFMHDLSVLFITLSLFLEFVLASEERDRNRLFLTGLILFSPFVWLLTLLMSAVIPIQLSVIWMSLMLCCVFLIISAKRQESSKVASHS